MNVSLVALSAILAALASGIFALIGVIVTSILAQRREHEADWRQTKIEHYQEYVAALSNIVSGRSTPAAQERYADAVNALALVASPAVLDERYQYTAIGKMFRLDDSPARSCSLRPECQFQPNPLVWLGEQGLPLIQLL